MDYRHLQSSLLLYLFYFIGFAHWICIGFVFCYSSQQFWISYLNFNIISATYLLLLLLLFKIWTFSSFPLWGHQSVMCLKPLSVTVHLQAGACCLFIFCKFMWFLSIISLITAIWILNFSSFMILALLTLSYRDLGLSMNILHTGNKSPVQRGFFTESAGDLLPTLGFLGGLYNIYSFVIIFYLI